MGALTVRDADEIMLITTGGQMVRIFVKDIREAGRNTQGVKLIDLAEGDKLQAIAPVISEQQEDAAVGQEEANEGIRLDRPDPGDAAAAFAGAGCRPAGW